VYIGKSLSDHLAEANDATHSIPIRSSNVRTPVYSRGVDDTVLTLLNSMYTDAEMAKTYARIAFVDISPVQPHTMMKTFADTHVNPNVRHNGMLSISSVHPLGPLAAQWFRFYSRLRHGGSTEA